MIIVQTQCDCCGTIFKEQPETIEFIQEFRKILKDPNICFCSDCSLMLQDMLKFCSTIKKGKDDETETKMERFLRQLRTIYKSI